MGAEMAVRCGRCGRPVFGAVVHPCCEMNPSRGDCPACAVSKQLGEQWLRVSRECELCRARYRGHDVLCLACRRAEEMKEDTDGRVVVA